MSNRAACKTLFITICYVNRAPKQHESLQQKLKIKIKTNGFLIL